MIWHFSHNLEDNNSVFIESQPSNRLFLPSFNRCCCATSLWRLKRNWPETGKGYV